MILLLTRFTSRRFSNYGFHCQWIPPYIENPPKIVNLIKVVQLNSLRLSLSLNDFQPKQSTWGTIDADLTRLLASFIKRSNRKRWELWATHSNYHDSKKNRVTCRRFGPGSQLRRQTKRGNFPFQLRPPPPLLAVGPRQGPMDFRGTPDPKKGADRKIWTYFLNDFT